MAFGDSETKQQETLDAVPDAESCNSAICLECATKYYEYIAESGEVVTNCVMCGSGMQIDDGSLVQPHRIDDQSERLELGDI